MKPSPNSHIRRFVAAAAICFAILVTGMAQAAERAHRVAVVPFQINAEKDLTFLRNGIADMLASRLSWENRVTVLGKEDVAQAVAGDPTPMNEIQAQILGAKLEADYVLFGSLTVFGESVSIDAKLVDVSGQQPAMAFFNQSEGMGKVIPRINQFASDINEKVFGRQVQRPRSAAAAPAAAARQTGAQDYHAHPEKLLESGYLDRAAGVETPQSSGLNPAFVMTQGHRGSGPQFWKSRDLKHRIIGMATGDVDGDKRIETVLVTPHAVLVTRAENGRLGPLQEIHKVRVRNIMGVDVADINNNGKAEIFVSSLNAHRSGVHSFVLEFNGQAFAPTVDSSRFLFRVARLPDRGNLLLGQMVKSGMPYRGTIYEMIPRGGDYISGSEIAFTRQSNLLGAAYGDIMNNGRNALVAYSNTDRIQILDASGKDRWKGSDAYGGTNQYWSEAKEEQGNIENRAYLPMRLLVWDLDGDGKAELLAAKNKEATGRLLRDTRFFTKGKLESLSWDGLGLATVWSTREVSGQISDFTVADFDNDGQDELVATIISKGGYIAGTSARSAIIAYDLEKKP